jgi:hypothetical protein
MLRSIGDGVVDPFAFARSPLLFVARVVSPGDGGIGLFSGNVSTGGALFRVFGGMIVGEVGMMGLGRFGFFGVFLDVFGEWCDPLSCGVVDFALEWIWMGVKDVEFNKHGCYARDTKSSSMQTKGPSSPLALLAMLLLSTQTWTQ